MHTAPIGPTNPDAGVIATRPATAPVQMPMTVGLPFMIHSTIIQVKPAGAVARGVTSLPHPGLQPRGPGGAGVEAEPADPEQRGADQGQDHVVGRASLGPLA